MLKKILLFATVIFVISAVFVPAASAENTVESGYSEYIPPEGEMPPATAPPEQKEEIDGWVEINPVEDQTWGSKISVSGVTNLGGHCTVFLQIYRKSEANAMISEETAISGNSDENKWSFKDLDISWCDPDSYTVIVRVLNNGKTLAESKTQFEIKKTYIEIESFSDLNAGETLNIVGKALIHDGKQLSVRIVKTPYDGNGNSGALAEKIVSPSESGVWSASFDTSGFEESGYLVLAGISGGDEFPKGENYFKIWKPVDSLSGIGDCVSGDTVTVRGIASSVVSGDINIYLIPFSNIPKSLLNSKKQPEGVDYGIYSIAKKTVSLSKENKGSFSVEFEADGFSTGEYLVIASLPSGECMTETFRVLSGSPVFEEQNAVSGQTDSGENEELRAEVEELRKKLEEKEQVIAEKESVIEEQKGIIESLMNLLSGIFG